MSHSELPLWTLGLVGVLAILAGGFLSAFSAKKPSRLASWASAYLVLIVGLFQAIIGTSLHYINKDPAVYLIFLTFTTYNLGNTCVLIGTALKSRGENYRLLVDFGGGLLIVSMLTLSALVRSAALSWQLVIFYIVILTILFTMPIGLTLSRRRKLKISKPSTKLIK